MAGQYVYSHERQVLKGAHQVPSDKPFISTTAFSRAPADVILRNLMLVT